MTLIMPTRERLIGRRLQRLHYRGISPALIRDVLPPCPPGTQASQAPGDVAWGDPSKIEHGAGGTCDVSLAPGSADSEVLLGTNLHNRAALPAAATVIAVTFNIIVSQTGLPLCALLQIVNHAGAQIGTDRAADLGILAGSGLQRYVVGDPANTLTAEWGAAVAALTIANWQHANTGFVLSFTAGVPGTSTVAIDYAWLEIYFEE